MDLIRLLFSLQGRVGRADYWLMVLLSTPFLGAAYLINGGIDSGKDFTDLPGVLVVLPYVWPTFAVTVKRWHDRNKSAWWLLLNLIPVIGHVWFVVETGFLKGTAGGNRFGADPVSQKRISSVDPGHEPTSL